MSFDGDLYPTAGATTVMTTKGDMVDFDTARQRLGIGSANQVLQVTAGGLPAWQTLATGGATVTTQSILFTAPQTTTSTGLTDITGSTITLPTRTGGLAFISVQLTCENTVSTSATQIGTYKNSADSLQSVNEQNAVNTANTINVSDTDDLDGGTLKARWAVQSGTSTLSQSTGSGRSFMITFEVS